MWLGIYIYLMKIVNKYPSYCWHAPNFIFAIPEKVFPLIRYFINRITPWHLLPLEISQQLDLILVSFTFCLLDLSAFLPNFQHSHLHPDLHHFHPLRHPPHLFALSHFRSCLSTMIYLHTIWVEKYFTVIHWGVMLVWECYRIDLVTRAQLLIVFIMLKLQMLVQRSFRPISLLGGFIAYPYDFGQSSIGHL